MDVAQTKHQNETLMFPPKLSAAVFYIGIPALTSLIFGVNHSGSARYMTALAGTGYWFGITLLLWLLLDIGTRLLVPAFRQFGAPVWTGVVAASILAVAIFDPFLSAYSRIAFPIFAPLQPYVEPSSAWDLLHRSPTQLITLLVVPLYWAVCLFVSKRLLRYPKYLFFDPDKVTDHGGGKPGPARIVDTSAGLFSLLPIGIGTDIISLHAEDHYVRVCTRYGEALIRYRFSDALNDVAGVDGMQIHRSHWVHSDAVDKVKTLEGRKHVELKDGRIWPVSRSYIGVLRANNFV